MRNGIRSKRSATASDTMLSSHRGFRNFIRSLYTPFRPQKTASSSRKTQLRFTSEVQGDDYDILRIFI